MMNKDTAAPNSYHVGGGEGFEGCFGCHPTVLPDIDAAGTLLEFG